MQGGKFNHIIKGDLMEHISKQEPFSESQT